MPEGDLQGAAAKSGKGATNDNGSYLGKGDPDVKLNGGNMVGPDYTGKDGLSTNLNPMNATGNSVNATVQVKNLPNGLGNFNDHGDHVSIYPKENMTFSHFQNLLNQIPWK